MTYELKFPAVSKFGWSITDSLHQEVDALKASKVLIITDEILKELHVIKEIIQHLEKQFEVKIYSDVEAEPSLACAQSIVDYTKEQRVDCVIGLGGGSILDIAKIAAVLSAHEGEVKDYLNISGERSIKHKGLPKILIPTTSGTGSEVTNISVLSLDGTKDVIVHEHMLADVALVDPALTMSVPPAITGATGADAITHAIEAYLSNQANTVTDALALKAIELIHGSLEAAVINGNDREARAALSEGSFLAGMAFFHAGVAGVHALAYPLGSKFQVAHGESNAVLLPYVISYISGSCPEKMKKVASLIDPYFAEEKQYSSSDYLSLLKQFTGRIHIPASLKHYGIKLEDLKGLTENAMEQQRLLQRSPYPLAKEDIYSIYKSAWEGAEKAAPKTSYIP
ncbi:iron-containing alcohol dehydrogenase [Alkalicoccus daliensis]|uniref:Alcohol dehydrogenase, class IV n=1 Tax=Alkalicoccus daliensis TaxID=745820 RepID=A0A1H0J0I7_9BACI|nr:iron-containing alcohol dehydrogenase [Alkalicoccus daliensis]SDO37073.1 Alcohol dehydrogenase, class IV [Alkalicoccus daliensis]